MEKLFYRAVTFILFTCLISESNANPLFIVSDVEVYARAETAQKAKEKALKQGQLKAFNILLQRLSQDPSSPTLSITNPSEIAQFILSYSLEGDEKIGKGIYRAHVTFHFDEERLGGMLDSSGIEYIHHPSNPVLLIPIHQKGENIYLWEDGENKWYEAWKSKNNIGGLSDIILPMGDIDDVQQLKIQDIYSQNTQRLKKIAQRYEASGILIAYYEESQDSLQPSQNIRLVYVTEEGKLFNIPTVLPPSSLPQTPYMIQAISKILQSLESFQKQLTHSKSRSIQSLVFTSYLSGLQEWLKIRQALDQLSPVRKIKILSLSRTKVKISLSYIGSVNYLKQNFQRHGLNLKSEGRSWVLVKTTARETL